jgi:hypothetical protein
MTNETESFDRGVEAMRSAVLADIAALHTAFNLSSSPDPRILGLLRLLDTVVTEQEFSNDS